MTNVIQWTPRRAIREALEQDGRKPAWLAKELGWDQSRVSRILSGERKLGAEELGRIANVQGRPLNWYFDPPDMVPIIYAPSPWYGRPIDAYSLGYKLAS